MGCPDSEYALDAHPKYQRWLYQRIVQVSLDIHRAPELSHIRFEDEHEQEQEQRDGAVAGTDHGPSTGADREIDIKCRKCRRLLAKSAFLVEHHTLTPTLTPLPAVAGKDGVAPAMAECAHLFLHPLGWMRSSLGEEGAEQLDGRLLCPNQKCGANVGKFAWQGMRCSCGGG